MKIYFIQDLFPFQNYIDFCAGWPTQYVLTKLL